MFPSNDAIRVESCNSVPAMTLKTEHSVGRSGITICIGIQNGGFVLELRKENHKQEQY